MILNLNYGDMQKTTAKGVVNGKEVKFFLRVFVNELNIQEAVDKLVNNKFVVALEYKGELGFLKTVDTKGMVVIVKNSVDKVDMNIDFYMNMVDSNIRMVFKLPDSYSDMRRVKEYSEKYTNIRFCGGNLLRLIGTKIGCIGIDDIPKKISESRIPLVVEKCGCAMENVSLDEVEDLEFIDDKVGVLSTKKSSSGVKKTSSKKVSSILKSVVTVEEDNF